MAVALDKMKARTKIIPVHWDGETVDVSYFPNIVTPEQLDKVEQAVLADDRNILGIMLEPILDWWDILETDGGPRLPCDVETINIIPMSFLSKLQTAITEDQNPPE